MKKGMTVEDLVTLLKEEEKRLWKLYIFVLKTELTDDYSDLLISYKNQHTAVANLLCELEIEF